jgi:glutathione S-transferase
MALIETTPACNATPRVVFALEEIGIIYDVVVKEDGHFMSTYGVPGPCLIDEGFRLFEGNPILRYLARSRSIGILMPTDPRAQGEVDRWLEFLVLRIGMSIVRGQVDAMNGYLGVLDRELGTRDWICGPFTVADCGFVTLARASERLPLEGMPHLRAYLARLVARPAWRRAQEKLAAGPRAEMERSTTPSS